MSRISLWRRGATVLCVCVGLCAPTGCEPVDRVVPFEPEALDTSEAALIGAVTIDASCPASVHANITEVTRRGRIVSRSTAFHECLNHVFYAPPTGVTLSISALPYGPYKACGSGPSCLAGCLAPPAPSPCQCDPLIGEPPARQLARLETAAGSRNDVVQSCSVPLGTATDAATSLGMSGSTERWRWTSLTSAAPGAPNTNLNYAPGVAWHVGMLNQGYFQGSNSAALQPAGCGFADTTQYTARSSAPGIVGACMREVLVMSALHCGNVSCPTGELAIVRSFAPIADCACVPDVPNHPRDENESGDELAAAMASGDFDLDGYWDLAVGAPGENGRAGAVYVFRGGPEGLMPAQRIIASQVLVRDDALARTYWLASEAGDELGAALVAADFNRDYIADLAIGIPGEGLESDPSCSSGACGYVVVVPGRRDTGLAFDEAQGIGQWSLGANESGDRFGSALGTIGHVSDELFLVVGAPEEVYQGVRSGVVFAYEQALKWPSISPEILLQPYALVTPQLFGAVPTDGDRFGATIAATYGALAVGAPARGGGRGEVFVVDALYGDLDFTATWRFTNPRDPLGATGFGSALEYGLLVGDGAFDLVIGAPNEASSAGSAYVYEGNDASAAALVYRQRLAEGVEPGDRFGTALAWYWTADPSHGNLAVGVPGETLAGAPAGQGIVMLFSGAGGAGLDYLGYRRQANVYSPGASDAVLPPETIEQGFGTTVVGGYFRGASPNEDDIDDVAVGMPLDRPWGGAAASGAVFVFKGGAMSARQKLDQRTTRYSAP